MIRLPSAANPEVSVIALLDGAPELAERCLRALAADDDSLPYETVLLLNDPDPALEDLVRRSTTGAKVIVSRANAGPGVGWNLAVGVSEAPRIATLHEDSEPKSGWLAPLCETMSETGAGAVGARLYNSDGSVQNCGWALFANGMPAALNAASAPEVVASTEPTPADVLSGAAMLVDREALNAIGGWDERFHPAVYGDIDISTAMWNQGRLVLSVPAASVIHQSGTFGRRPNSVLTGPRLAVFLIERNRERFLTKWGQAMDSRAPAPPINEPESTRAAVEVALPVLRERAEQVRAGERQPGEAKHPERHFTDVPNPVLAQDDETYAVAAEVEESLKAAEQELIGDYCRWLTGREAETFDELAEARELLKGYRRQILDLQREHQEVVTQLDHIRRGSVWCLRNRARGALRRLRGSDQPAG